MSAPPTAERVLLRRAALRLGLQAGLLAGLIVVLLTIGAVAVMLTGQQRAATMLLDAAVARADDVVDPPAGVWLVMHDDNGTVESAGLPAGAADLDALARVASSAGPAAGSGESAERAVAGVEYRVTTVRQADGTVVQGILDLTANHRERDQLILTMLLVGGVGLLLAAGLGTWLGFRALRPLSTALALQRRFVADAGHELRTPVTLLSTRAQLLRRKIRERDSIDAANADAELLPDLDGIVADSARLGAILEDLLLAADPVTAAARQPVDLTTTVREVLDAATAEAREHAVELSGPAPDAPARWVPGSPVALRRAVTALVDNALRHARHAVTVAVDTGNGDVLVDVGDDGPGIDPELLPRLFERFVAGSDPSSARRRYGLGLALVSEIAAAHGGQVEVLDTAGTGATLRMRLPAI